MYPQNNLASTQPGFMGMPNSGQNMYGGQPPQAMGYQTPAFMQFYPQWFTQRTGLDVTQVELCVVNTFKSVLNQLAHQLRQAFPFSDLMGPTAEQVPEFHRLLNKARCVVIAMTAGGVSKGIQSDCVLGATIALYGAIVDRLTGPNIMLLENVKVILNVDVMSYHHQYLQAESECARVVRDISNMMMANVGMAQYNNAPINNGYSTAKVAQSALLNTNVTAGVGYVTPFQKPPTPFDGVGNIEEAGADIYTMSLRRTVQADPKPVNQYVPEGLPINSRTAKTNVVRNDNGLNGGVMDPFTLIGAFGGKALLPVQDEPDPVVEQKRSVIPQQATRPVTEAPIEGMPSIGHYEFGIDKFDPERYRIPATTEEHVKYRPEPTHQMNSANEEFILELQREAEALEQTMHERNIESMDHYASLDDVLAEAEKEGYAIKQPRLEVPYDKLNGTERNRICRDFRIRIVPAYMRAKSGLIQIAEGNVREVIIQRWDNVNYSDHETEVEQAKIFASWDRTALDASAAKNILATAATQDIWDEQFFLNKLAEKLEDNPQTEQDMLLSELIADRQIVDIDDLIQTKTSGKDYVTEVLDELTSRGVTAAGTLLDNCVVRYKRFETTGFALQGENLDLVNAMREGTSAADIVVAINDFKCNTTLPLRETARILDLITLQVNRYLATEFSNGWSITSLTGDYTELSEALIEHFEHIYDEHTVLNMLHAIYVNAVKYAFAYQTLDLTESDVTEVGYGTLSRVALVPFYYSQYPIDFLDQAGAIVKEEYPELYDFLNAVNGDNECYEIKLVTLDNVVLTFCQTLGEDRLIFLVEKN